MDYGLCTIISMSKRFLIILILCALGLGALFWFTRDKASTPNQGSQSQTKPSEHLYGEGKKNVRLVEYGDFQCPACGGYFPILKYVKDKYKTDITFQFRNFPLVQLHRNAMAAHRAAEAAAKQDKFWEMHDMLYQQQKDWEQSSKPDAIFEAYAMQLGLDIQKFKQAVASSEVNDIINADMNEGKRLGVEATPSFFLNGKKLTDPPRDVDGFSKLIEDEIKSSQNNQQGNQ